MLDRRPPGYLQLSSASATRPPAGIAGILWAAISPTAAFACIAVWMIVALTALVLRDSHGYVDLDRTIGA